MTLYLLPNVLGPVADHRLFLPSSVDMALSQLDGLIAESEKEGRRYLSRFNTKKRAHEIPLALLNEHTNKDTLDFLLEPVLKGEKWGVISDAGLPCLADPGALLVQRAYQHKINVQCFPGPSSITHALLLSGLQGQNFYFHGYISKHPDLRKKELKMWEKIKNTTHLFIEAPYRNVMAFNSLLETLSEATLLCIGTQLTLPDQWISTKKIAFWKKENRDEIAKKLAKQPTIFLFQSYN